MARFSPVTCLVAAVLFSACGVLEPSADDLIHGASSKLRSAKTVHVDGTISMALRGGFSMSFDMKMLGDVELPDKARMTMQMSFFGQSLEVEAISIGDKAYAKDPTTGAWTEAEKSSSSKSFDSFFSSDPLGSLDLSNVAGVVEIDRPVIDSIKTRHLRYTADPRKMTDTMRNAAGSSPLPFSNPTAIGEVWIRVDDGLPMRQSVKVTFDIDDMGAAFFRGVLPGASASPSAGTKASFELGFDFKFSKYGEPVPAITAPPVTSPRLQTIPPVLSPRLPTPPPVRTSTPLRSASPLPTR